MTRSTLCAVALVAGLSGCATQPKEISFDPQTGMGVVAIPAKTDVWPTYNYSQAMALIQKKVGPNYEILDEQTVSTGQQTTNNQTIDKNQTFGATTTTDVTEYRIVYRKRPGAMTGVGALPGMGTPNTTQTQYMQGAGAANGAVRQTGGIVPSVAPLQQTGGAYGSVGGGMYNMGRP